MVAAPVTYFGLLTGSGANPPNSSSAAGLAIVTIDDDAHTLFVSATFSGLSAPDTAAHIHCCTTEPMNIGVATTTPYFSGFPTGQVSGTFSNTLDTTSASTYSTTFVQINGSIATAEAVLFAGIAGGNAYFDIHTTMLPGGEIRSFLYPDGVFANGMEPP